MALSEQNSLNGQSPFRRRPRTRIPFRNIKSSPKIIRLAVTMYVRFPLSLRQVEDLLHERGMDISYETVRTWWNRFGPMFANEIKKSGQRRCGACHNGDGSSTRYLCGSKAKPTIFGELSITRAKSPKYSPKFMRQFTVTLI